VIAGLPPHRFAALAALVFFAGIVDSLAGGGGLITLPAYLAAGLSPALVLGTNKLGSCIGTTASVFNYHRGKTLSPKRLALPVAACLLGSFLGARLATLLHPTYIRTTLLVVLPVLAAFLFFRRDFGHTDETGRHTPAALQARTAAVTLPCGFYDGIFGPGTGTFMALGLTRVAGFDLLEATGLTKLFNLSTNAAALATFLYAGRVSVPLGLSMAVASLGGHYTGSHLGLRGGARTIRPAVLLVCAALFVKLLLDVCAGR
jgi:uncharacterized membrane protein YfcA